MSTRFERCAPTATKTASKPPSCALGGQILDLVRRGDAHAHRLDPVELAARARRVADGRPGSRSASSRPARRPSPGSPPRDRAGRGGRRPTDRTARHRSRAPARRCGPGAGRIAIPARARGRRGTARPSGSRPRCRDRPGCRRSRTGGSRPARGSRGTDCRRRARATPARAGPPWCARARPGCSRPPGSRHCTAATDRHRPGGAPGPDPCRECPCSRSGSGVTSCIGSLIPAPVTGQPSLLGQLARGIAVRGRPPRTGAPSRATASSPDPSSACRWSPPALFSG